MRYNGSMRLQVWAWRCELDGCGHTWLAAGIDPPAKCAKCKKRSWHKKDAVHPSSVTQVHWQTNNSLNLPGIEREPAKPTMQSLRDICAGSSKQLQNFHDEELLHGIEIPICGFKWWEEGEQYECLMDAGHSIPLKHGRNGMVRKVDE